MGKMGPGAERAGEDCPTGLEAESAEGNVVSSEVMN